MKSFYVLFIFCSLTAFAQEKTPILERKLTMRASNEKLPSVLTRIGKSAGFSFSYNASLVPADQLVTLDVTGKTVREALKELLDVTLTYKEKGNHLIITRMPTASKKTTAVFIISGYVEDETTGKKVADASVYDKNTLSSAVTDQYGFYKIRLDPARKTNPLQLTVSKADYKDTLVMITGSENQYVTIGIRPVGKDSVTITIATPKDSTAEQKDENLKFPFNSEANVVNIHDTLYRDIQVSLLPFIGTNGHLSGNVINDYSINFFGGYSRGTRRIELGFFVNADRGDVSYLQIAGMGNLVYRNVYGVQAAGFFNLTGGDVRAVQLAGLTNTNLGEAKGIQVSGLANINVSSADGVLVTGGLNIVNGVSEGFQVAGFGNFQTRNYKGSQIAGLTNIAARDLRGSQVSALFNYGRHVHGSQIGLINFSDSLSGVPIGLVSFVSHGYHQVEVSADEVFYTNLAFRTGVRQFYNILAAGVQPESMFGNNQTIWSFGYGIGTAPRITRWLSLNIDLTSNQVNKGSFTRSLSLLNKAYIGFDVRLARKFSMTLGGTINGYMTNPKYEDNPTLFTDFNPHIFSDHNFNSRVNMKMWLGAKVGLRFL